MGRNPMTPNGEKSSNSTPERVFRIAYRILGSVHDARMSSQTMSSPNAWRGMKLARCGHDGADGRLATGQLPLIAAPKESIKETERCP